MVLEILVEPLDDEVAEPAETVIATLAVPPSAESPGYSIDREHRSATVTILANDSPSSPRLEVTKPASGAEFQLGEPIVIEAIAVNPLGYIPRVIFYDGPNPIGVSEINFLRFQPPQPGTPIEHSFVWENAPVGEHRITARAVLDNGQRISSESVPVVVRGETTETIVSVRFVREPNTALLPDAEYAPGYFEIRRSGSTDHGLMVFFELEGTATPGIDYELDRANLIPPQEQAVRVRIHAIDDTIPEGEETVVMVLTRAPLTIDTPYPTEYVVDPEHSSATGIIYDNDRPSATATLEITKPETGATFPAGATIVIEAVAIDPEGYIPRVEFYAGERLIDVSEIVFIRAPDPGTPIQHTIEWTNPPPGEHKLHARAVDSNGNSIRSAPVLIRVRESDTPRPLVAIVRPHNGAVFTLGSPIEIRAEASIREGSVASLEIYAGERRLGEVAGADSLAIVWEDAPLGEHSLYARVTDDTGAEARSAAVRILVRKADSEAFVSRELPASYTPGVTFEVRLRANPPAGTSAYGVEDQPPRGWEIGRISHEGVFDSATGRVKFGPYTDNESRLLTYQLTPPSNATGRFEFTGAASANGHAYDIIGDRIIAGGHLLHPADQDSNGRISLTEVTAYAAAWKEGEQWLVAPNAIPVSYVTRAGMLWRRGESYRFTPEAPAPLCWVSENAREIATLSMDSDEPVSIRSTAQALSGGPVLVEVSLAPGSSANAYAAEEIVPRGWSASEISGEGRFDSASSVIRWGPFLDNERRVLRYSLSSATGESISLIRGIASVDGGIAPTKGAETVSSDPTAVLRLPELERATDGSIRLKLAGPSGQICVLEVSSDLQNWAAVRELFLPDGQLELSEITSSVESRQFYRLRVP